jgi:hypothetical protein
LSNNSGAAVFKSQLKVQKMPQDVLKNRGKPFVRFIGRKLFRTQYGLNGSEHDFFNLLLIEGLLELEKKRKENKLLRRLRERSSK